MHARFRAPAAGTATGLCDGASEGTGTAEGGWNLGAGAPLPLPLPFDEPDDGGRTTGDG